ncbi:hypothetical protein COO72_10295 [Bifidobacterium callitrichos]|nr:hypothetical protein COO72_10295 [Bifidobacterium callitrichos]
MSNKGVTKKLVAAVAAVGALSMVLAGCGSDSNKAQVDENGKPIINVAYNNGANQDVTKMPWTKDLEAACDCTIKWTQISDAQGAQQKSATLTAGNPADVSIRMYHPSDAQKYPFFEDLKPHLDKMPNVKAFFEEQPDAEGIVTTPDGKIYTLPRYQGKIYKASGQHLFINKAWLDKLGLQVPQTWDELFKVMDAFKNDDPNGNGQKDEIPYAMRNLDMTGIGWWSPFLFLNSTGITTQFNGSAPSGSGFYVKNGKVKDYLTSDEYRQVIEFLHTMIEKGYSPKDSLTQDSSKYYASLTGSTDGKTATVGLAITNLPSAFGDLKDQYEAIPWPASEPGVTAVADRSQEAGAIDDYGLAVSKNAQNKDAIYKLIDTLYSKEFSITQKYGQIGDWISDDGNDTYTVDPKIFKLGANDKAPMFQDRLAGWIPDSVTIKGDTSAEDLLAADKVYEEQLSNIGEGDYFPISILPSDADSTTLSNDRANIMNAALVQVAKWIQDGGLSDSAWKSYSDGLKGLNLDQDTQLWQKWYDEAKKK